MISDVNLKKYFPLDDFVNYNYATYIEIIKKSYKKVNNLKDFIQLHLNSIKKSYNYKLKTKIDMIKDVSGTPSAIINDFLNISENNKIIIIRRSSKYILKAIFNNRKISLIKKIVRCYTVVLLNNYIDNLSRKKNSKIFFIEYEKLLSDDRKDKINEIFNFLNLKQSKENYFPTLHGNPIKVKTASSIKFKNQENFNTTLFNKFFILFFIQLFKFLLRINFLKKF